MSNKCAVVSSRFNARGSLSKACVLAASAVALSLLGTSPVHAANLQWDSDATPGNGANGGAGVWDLATTNWFNGTTDIAWTDITGATDFAFFGGTSGIVTLSSNLGVRGLVFTTSGYNVTGANTIKLGNNGLNAIGLTTGTTTIDSAIALTSSQTWSVGSGATVVLNGALSETAVSNLTKTGAGTLTFTGATAYTGQTSINGGQVNFSAGSTISSGALGLTNAELTIAGGSPTVGAMTNGQGRGIMTLSSASTTFTAASLANRALYATPVYRGNGLGTGSGAAIKFSTAPTLTTNGTTMVNGENFTATGTGTLGTTQAAVLRGVLADSSATGNGAGFATYDATNGVRVLTSGEQVAVTNTAGYAATSAGDNVRINSTVGSPITAISIAGKQTNTLQLDNTNGSTTMTVTNTAAAFVPTNGLLFSGSAPITLAGSSALTFATVNATEDLPIISTNTGQVTITAPLLGTKTGGQVGFSFSNIGPMTITGTVTTGGGQGETYNGPGTVTLNGTHSYSSSGLQILGGTVKLATGYATANLTSSVRPIKVANGATLDLNGIAPTYEYPSDLNSAGGVITNTGALATLTFNQKNSTGTSATYSGVITGNINYLEAVDPATINAITTLSGKSTYSGTTTISNGAIKLGISDAFPTGTALTVTATNTTAATTNLNAQLDLAGFNQKVKSLSGVVGAGTAGILNSSTTTSTLTIDGGVATTSTTYSNQLNDGGAGKALALVKAGSTTQTLTNGSSTYTGGTAVTGGMLYLNPSAPTGTPAGTGPITVTSSTLSGAATVGALTANAAGHLQPGVGGSGAGGSVGTLATNGLTLNSNSVFDVDMTAGSADKIVSSNGITFGTGVGFNLFTAGSASQFSTAGTYTLFTENSANFTGFGNLSSLSILNPVGGLGYAWGISGNDVTLTISGGSLAAQWANANGSTWGTGTNWTSNPSFPNAAGDSAIFGNNLTSSGQVDLGGTARTVGSVTFNNTNGSSYDLTNGTLTINNNAAIGSITNANGNHTISANVNLVSNTNVSVTNAADVLNISGNISGGAMNVLGGAGTVIITGANSYGATTIAAGNTLQVGNGGTTGTLGAGAVTVNGTLVVNRSDAVSISQSISGTGGTVKLNGSGSTTLLGTASSGTWGIEVNGAPAFIGNGNAAVVGSGPVALNQDLTVNSTANNTFGALSGGGTLNKQASGTLALSAASPSYSGTVNVTGGNLKLGPTAAAGTGQINLNSAALSESSATATHANNIDLQGTVSIDTDVNTMNLTGQLTGSGTVNRNGGTGTLTLNSANTTDGNKNFAGTFNNSAGVLNFGHKASGSAAAVWNFTSPSAVTFGNLGGTINFGGLNGTSAINSTGNSRIRVGGGNDVVPGTFNSAFSGPITGASLSKDGLGTFTVSGQNSFTNDAITGLTGTSSIVISGTMNAASSTGASTGPLGGPTQVTVIGNATSGANGQANLFDATLGTFGAVTVSNPIIVSAGYGTATATPYTLKLAGNSDNNSSFTGAISLQNNLTIAQVATTGANALTVAGNLTGSPAGTGILGNTAIDGPNNTGLQTVTLAGPGKINVTGAIADGGGVVSVASTGGTATISGANTYTGSTTANAGRLITATAVKNGAAMSITNNGVIEVPTNGLAAGVTRVSSLTINTGGKLDLHDNDLVVENGAGPAGYSALASMVVSGQIFSSTPAAGTRFGIKENSAGVFTALSGYSLPNPTISTLVKYTWLGDANLDGKVDGTDYALTDTGFGSAGNTWSVGDYNYSGNIDGTDYSLIDTGFGSQSGTLPEPTALGLLGLGAMGMLRRRRHQA